MKTIKGPDLKSKLSEVPTTPGVYHYLDSNGKIIYVGKAKNLRNRVRSYFNVKLNPTSKTAALVKQIQDIVYIETLSELEALILEAALIKKHQPKYNIALKDDKSYLYIVIRPEKLKIRFRSGSDQENGIDAAYEEKTVTLPRVFAARTEDLKKGDISFGPYPHGQKAKSVIRTLRKIIPYRDCSTSKFSKHNKLNSACLYGHIGLCSAPCTDKTSPKKYQKDISRIKKLLNGDSTKFLKSVEKEMSVASKKQNYEEAAHYRDILNKFNYIRQKFSQAQQYIDNPYLVQDLRETALNDLRDAIPFLQDIPRRIECYDISNISGTDAVGSMVVAIEGEIDKSEYKRFKIKTKNTPDDFHMMKEVLYRRLKHSFSLDKISNDDDPNYKVAKVSSWEPPDLIVLDGGKGQLSSVLDVLTRLNIDIPIIGLAKKQETIVYYEDYKFHEVNLDITNEGLKLLQRLRDEAHRFAQSYHHKLRLKQLKEAGKR